MRCGLLGPLEIRGESGALLDVPGAKERLLLALLAAASPHVVTVEQLAEQLWDGRPPPSARKSLQACVVRLRTALEPDRPRGSPGRFVVRRQRGYALVCDREDLDTTALADRATRGRAQLASGDAAAADTLVLEALDLWRGEPYADWPDVLALENERVRLRGVHDLASQTHWEAQLALGRHGEALPDLRRLTLERPLQERWWELLALASYRAGNQGEALDALRRAREVLAEQLGVDPGAGLRDLERDVLAQDPSLELNASAVAAPVPHAEGPVVTGCPWKGLARYEPGDAALFHGRDRLVATVVGALVDHPVVVLAGSSGAGKSSVARAGLVPDLLGGSIPGSEGWQPLVLTLGAHPVDALAPLTGDQSPEAPVLLVCDQLEQLWSPEVPVAERAVFLDSVLGLVADDVVARALLVVRGDHVGRLAEHPELAERMLGGLVMVPPMTEPELRQVVEEPASAAGLRVEPELTDAAVQDVLGRAGALPLLSTALVQTWERRRDHALTLAGYLASGGVAGAIGRSAERVHDGWDDAERQQARQILVRLAEQGEDGTVRARRLLVAELAATGTDDTTRRVVDDLVAARLLAREDDHLEVAHEALLTGWPRLAGWLDEDAAGRTVRRHLAPAALEWEAKDRPDDELYRGARLEVASDWVGTPNSGATPVERAFVEAGLVLAEAELTAARERAEAEAVARRRTRRFAALLAGVLVLALVATAGALVFQRRAGDQAEAARVASTIADANRLAALSSTARALDVSLLLAAAAVETADTPATRDGLLTALIEHRRASGVHQLNVEGVQETALSENGRTMMATVGGGSPRVLVWRPGRPGGPRVVEERFWPNSIDVSEDGRTLVAAGWNHDHDGLFVYTAAGDRRRTVDASRLGGFPFAVGFTGSHEVVVVSRRARRGAEGQEGVVAEVDLADGHVTRIGSVGHTTTDDVFVTASVSDDGEQLIVGDADGRAAWRRDLSTGRVTRLELVHRDATSLEVVPLPAGGSAQLWSDGTVTRYDARGRAVQELDVHQAAVRDVRMLPGGTTAVTTGDDGEVVLWDVAPGGRWSFGESLEGHTGPVVQAEASADARSLLTASSDGQVVTWDLTADAGLGSTYPGLEGRFVSNRLEVVDPGRLVVAPTRTLSQQPREITETPGTDTYSVAAVFLDPRNGEVLDAVVVGDTVHSVFGSSVAVSPDGGLVSVSSALLTTVLDTHTRDVVARVRVPHTFVSDSTWSSDGSQLILGADLLRQGGSVGGALHVVDADSWEVERVVRLEHGTPQVLEWSPDRQTLAVGANYTGTVTLFDPQLREQRTLDLGEGGDVFDLSFSPDGRYLAAGRFGGVLTVLDTRTWKPVHESVTMHAEWIGDVEWLPDSNTVVTAGRDEMVSLYDVDRDLVRGTELPASSRPGDGYTFLLPDPTDELVVFNEGGPGHVYPLDPAQWLGLACTVAGRDLTPAEWDRYLPDRPYEPVCGDLIGEE